MPSVQLLDTQMSVFRRFSLKVAGWLSAVASQVTGNEPKDEHESGPLEEGFAVSKVETEAKSGNCVSLFPAVHHVDRELDGNASIVPCSMSIGGLQSPMSVTRTPEGQMEWKLNSASGDGKALKETLGQKTQNVTPDGEHTSLSTLYEEDSASIEKKVVVNAPTESKLGKIAQPVTPAMPNTLTPIHPSDDDSCDDKDAKVKIAEKKSDPDAKYVCHYCGAEFKMRGYLTRHIKKHALEKAYHCPFWDESLPPKQRCHPTGGFSRRDSYKTHLKSKHFIYPENVKGAARAKSSGHCGFCKKFFNSTDEWIETHIETGECEGISASFKGNLKKSKKSNKLKMIMTADGKSRFISSQPTSMDADIPEAAAHHANRISKSVSRPKNKKTDPIIRTDSDLSLNSSSGITSIPLNFSGMVHHISDHSHGHDHHQCHDHCHHIHDTAIESYNSVLSDSFVMRPETKTVPELVQHNTMQNAHNNTHPLTDFFALDHSPNEDSALDSVRSISSQSSHEHTSIIKDMSFLPIENNIAHSTDMKVLPLDLEQAGVWNDQESNLTKAEIEVPRINTILQRQMDDYALGERHYRETQQFMNFFDYTFSNKH